MIDILCPANPDELQRASTSECHKEPCVILRLHERVQGTGGVSNEDITEVYERNIEVAWVKMGVEEVPGTSLKMKLQVSDPFKKKCVEGVVEVAG